MTPRSRVEAVLKGKPSDRIPFTVYEDVLPRCEDERAIRNAGLCLVARRVEVFETICPNVEKRNIETTEAASTLIQTELQTPLGDLSTTRCEMRSTGYTWMTDRLFKTPDDYDAITFMARDTVFIPQYERLASLESIWGDDVFAVAEAGYSPFQEIVFSIMGLPAFSIEWFERRDRVLELYDALLESHQRLFPIIADAPVDAAVYDGNVTESVVGLDRFKEYYVPAYRSAQKVLHEHGKLLGVRANVDTLEMAAALGASGIDFIDGFTPDDSAGFSLAEGMTIWPDKIIWVNFPPSAFALGPEACEDTMRQLLRESAPGNRVIFGVSEDALPENWAECLPPILRVLESEFDPPESWVKGMSAVAG